MATTTASRDAEIASLRKSLADAQKQSGQVPDRLYRDQKTRASDLSRDLDASQREIKTWQNRAAEVEPLKEKVAELKADLESRDKQVDELTRAVAAAELAGSAVQKRADAFLAIRDALETK